MCLLPVCLNWPGFPASACKGLLTVSSACSGACPPKNIKAKLPSAAKEDPVTRGLWGLSLRWFFWGGGEEVDREGDVFYKEHPFRKPWACSHFPPWLGGLSPRETLGAKPPGGDREERGGVQQWQGRVVTLERLPVPRGRAGLLQSLRLLPQVTRIPSLHCIRAWGGQCRGVVSARPGET